MDRGLLKEIQEYIDVGLCSIDIAKHEWLEQQTFRGLLTNDGFQWALLRGETDGKTLLRQHIQAQLSKIDKKLLGRFLSRLAVFVAVKIGDGFPSSFPGIDVEIIDSNAHNVIVVKPDSKWSKAPSKKKLINDMTFAVSSIISAHTLRYRVERILGICVGRKATRYNKLGILEITGTNFWFFVSGRHEFYEETIIPLLHQAKHKKVDFVVEENETIERLVESFWLKYCDLKGQINWPALLQHTSGNYDLDKFLS